MMQYNYHFIFMVIIILSFVFAYILFIFMKSLIDAWNLVVWVLHLLLHLQLLLTFPKFSSTVWISCCWESSNIFRNIHLIKNDNSGSGKFEFILKPWTWNSKIEICCDFKWWIRPQKDFPVIINVLINRSKSNT